MERGFELSATERAACPHGGQTRQVRSDTSGCEECLKTGDRWVHLRICMSCGSVGCCDSSKNRHATRHNGTTGHPIIKSYEKGQDWAWCYPDELMLG